MARRRPPLLEHIDAHVEPQPRGAYLVAQLSQRIDFMHRQHLFTYVHIQNLDETIVVGRLGRKETERATDAPETGYAPVRLEVHRAVNLFLDTSSDPNGQKLALQVDPKVGTPSSLLNSLVEHINNSNPDGPWIIDVRAMIDEVSFWEAVDAHENEITNVTFKLVAPNIFGFTDNVAEEMKAVRDENNANIATVSLDNKEGLKLKTDSIRNAVKYVSAGGGIVTLRGKLRKFFDSRKKHRNITVENDVAAVTGMPETLTEISTKLFER